MKFTLVKYFDMNVKNNFTGKLIVTIFLALSIVKANAQAEQKWPMVS